MSSLIYLSVEISNPPRDLNINPYVSIRIFFKDTNPFMHNIEIKLRYKKKLVMTQQNVDLPSLNLTVQYKTN